MSEQSMQNRPMGPLEEGDQAVIDVLQQIPHVEYAMYVAPHETTMVDLTASRETVPGLPKDHWSVASLETDEKGMPNTGEVTLVTMSSKSIDVILRGADAGTELRTATDSSIEAARFKIHDRQTEQSIKVEAAERLHRAAANIVKASQASDSK